MNNKIVASELQVSRSDEQDEQEAEERNSQPSIRLTSKSLGGQQANGMSINRQHLSARVKTITGKLLESHGAELRRTLFSLRQIFQDEPDLASEFIETDGLECLLKVAVEADQIHQNYILRALGQLLTYPSGMNGLTRHNETIRWLYTLLESQHRLVVKTSIKLLLLFVENSDNNCLHFCRAIKSIDESKGSILWTNVIELFKQQKNCKEPQDVGLLIDAMTLINKTLAGIPDQDTYYDFVLPLEELGIESIIKKNSSLDAQLKEQFDLYDQVLKTEDEDSTAPLANTMENKMVNNGRALDSGSRDGSPVGGVDQRTRRKSKRVWALTSKEEDGKCKQAQQVERIESVEMNDDNYESANESNESNKQTSTPPSPIEETTSTMAKKQQHPLIQAPSQQQLTKQNLARGKQQRASISSCSSSDSYASYGSGYASGSGNSTDLEQKQKTLLSSNEKNSNQVVGCLDSSNSANNNNNAAAVASRAGTQEIDDDSRLKQHLSELEQLTDELASRNIFGKLTQPVQSTSKHFSSTIKSTSSNSSSILSTGSNISSLSAPANDTILQARVEQQQQQSLEQQANNDSRSTSATPTSLTQPNSTSLPYKPAYLTRKASNGEMAFQTQITRPAHHYATPATNTQSQQQQQQQQQQASSGASPSTASCKQEPYYHNLFQWEQLVSKGVTRPLLINDLDFTDLIDEDDCELLNSSGNNNNNSPRARNQATGEPLTINIPGAQHTSLNNDGDSIDSGTSTGSPNTRANTLKDPASAPPPMPPPPISPWFNTISGGRPQSQFMSSPSPPYEQQSSGEFNRDQSPANSTYSNYSRNSVCVPQASTPTRDTSAHHHQYNTLQPLTSLRSASSMSSLLFGNNGKYANKRKKTMKLFWKEVREDRSLLSKLTKKRTIWDEIKPVAIDTQKLEHLFESKAKDLLLSKSRNGLDGINQRKVKITVLDAKRSNAINIGMTKLPPMRTIKSAILKMDSSIMNREGIEKILTTMMPSEEEKSRIIEAQLANPDTPLGTAEQFLLNLASISALEARLKLWAFQLDYAQIEKEVAEPLMDLKQAIEEIERSETFRIILGTLLAIGNFLNSTSVKGFQIDYLEKVPEVKDTVNKHSLLHHLCLFIQEKYDPQLVSDLYSEFSAVNRASKVDYTEVAKNLKKMQQDCKASWDYLKIVAKHDGLANLMNTSCSSSSNNDSSSTTGQQQKSSGKLNNLSKLSMITTVISTDNANSLSSDQQAPTTKQLKTKVSDFLTDCAERIMVLIVIHRRVMNRFQKLLVYLGCPSHQIKQTQPQQVLKIINEFALEYRTKRERVREMLMKKQHCQHHNHHQLSNRWQFNRSRWAGSQQCIDSLGYNNHHLHRPCSTTSSCASSYATNVDSSLGDPRNMSIDSHHHANQQNASINRTSSPSGFSQISNYSDYLFDQSCCNSRQQSITPVPAEKSLNNRRPHSMSVSMFDLQNQQQNCRDGEASSCKATNNIEGVNKSREETEQVARQKDEQLRRLLGAGKSFDDTCNDLYQMSHWSSTITRVSRHPPSSQGSSTTSQMTKQRAASMDSPCKDDEIDASDRRQSSYYRYLHNGRCIDAETENSDEEIMQSLVRTAMPNVHAHGSQNNQNGLHNNRLSVTPHSAVNKGARNKILSRFNCDRKSFRRTLRGGIELSNVG